MGDDACATLWAPPYAGGAVAGATCPNTPAAVCTAAAGTGVAGAEAEACGAVAMCTCCTAAALALAGKCTATVLEAASIGDECAGAESVAGREWGLVLPHEAADPSPPSLPPPPDRLLLVLLPLLRLLPPCATPGPAALCPWWPLGWLPADMEPELNEAAAPCC